MKYINVENWYYTGDIQYFFLKRWKCHALSYFKFKSSCWTHTRTKYLFVHKGITYTTHFQFNSISSVVSKTKRFTDIRPKVLLKFKNINFIKATWILFCKMLPLEYQLKFYHRRILSDINRCYGDRRHLQRRGAQYELHHLNFKCYAKWIRSENHWVRFKCTLENTDINVSFGYYCLRLVWSDYVGRPARKYLQRRRQCLTLELMSLF